MATTDRECPEEYEEHSNACYYFGSYSSHNAAMQSCEAVGARLVEVNSINSKYVKEKIHFLGGNDHWIGSFVERGRVTKKKANNCPMLKGQSGRSGAFSLVNCNSAYPYICQKYGENRFSGGNRDVVGYNGFIPGEDGEFELPISPKTTEVTTAPAEETGSDSSLIAAVSCIIILIVLAIMIRFFCNKRAKRKLRKEKQLLQKQQAENKTLAITDKSSSNTLNSIGKPRSNVSMIKPISIPETKISLDQPPLQKRPSMNDASFYENTVRYSDEDEDYHHEDYHHEDYHHEDERSYHSKQYDDDGPRFHRSQSRRTPSFERHLHGQHEEDFEPPPPYQTRYRRHHSRSRSRRRSMSALDSMTELATTRYSSDSDYSEDQSHFSDSAISTSTATTFRSFRRGRSHRRLQSYATEDHASEPHFHNREKRHHSRRHHHGGRREHRGRRRHREDARMEPHSRFEQYAVGRPPSPALDVLERNITSEKFRQQQSYLKRSLPRSDGYQRRRERSRPQESTKPTYFPQIFTTWSQEDLRITDSYKKSKSASQPSYPRSMPKTHIRVNRRIHDFETPSQRKPQKDESKTDDSDHVYESLDEVESSRKNHKKTQAIPLRSSKTNAIPDSSFSRDYHRSSGRSRASIRSRGYPVAPFS